MNDSIRAGIATNKRGKDVFCDRLDCFANEESKKIPGIFFCRILADNDFGGGGCPFFKTDQENEASLQTYEQRKIKLAKEAAEKRKREHVRIQSGVTFKH